MRKQMWVVVVRENGTTMDPDEVYGPWEEEKEARAFERRFNQEYAPEFQAHAVLTEDPDEEAEFWDR